jgi:hypothetical protein
MAMTGRTNPNTPMPAASNMESCSVAGRGAPYTLLALIIGIKVPRNYPTQPEAPYKDTPIDLP